jgi:transmembrane sensor
MMHLSEHEQYLLLSKMTGSITAEEQEELNTLLLERDDINAAWAELTQKLPAQYVANSFDHLNNKKYWSALDKRYNNKPVIALWKKLAIAAAIMGLISIALFILLPQKNSSLPVAHTPKKEIIALKLASGKTIDLSNQRGIINTDGADINNVENSFSYQTKNNPGNGINSIVVPAGMDYKITLSDGSIVWMNSLTKLDFPFNFSSSTREITISGEAYLDIAQHSSKPFIVHLPGSSVKVLGTEFNVNTYDSTKIKVALVSGAVNLNGGDNTITINRGKEGIYNPVNGISQQPFDAKIVLSWKKGLFYFEDAGIVEISKVIERWYSIKTTIDNKEIYDMKFAGVLDKKQSIEAFLDDLKAVGKITSSFDDNGVLHFR